MAIIEEEKKREIEQKLKEAGEEWEKVQKEWESFKKDWWRVFSVITSAVFFVSVIRNGFRAELYIWFILIISFTIYSLYVYKKKMEEVEYLKKIGFLKDDKDKK